MLVHDQETGIDKAACIFVSKTLLAQQALIPRSRTLWDEPKTSDRMALAVTLVVNLQRLQLTCQVSIPSWKVK